MQRLALSSFLRPIRKLSLAAVVLLVCLSIGSGTARAVCTINFDGGAATNSWHDPANWDTDVLPISTDMVCIGASFAVTYSTGSTTIAGLEHTSTQPFTFSGGTLTLTGASTIGSAGLNQSGGTIDSSSTLTIAGPFIWTGGTQSGSGITNLNGGLTLSGGSKTVLSRTVNSSAAVTSTGADSLSLGSGAVFNNNGSFDLQTGAGIGGAGGLATFNNAGTFTKSAGTNSVVSVPFNNTGMLNASSGILTLVGGGSCGGTCNGSFNVGATLRFDGGPYDLGGTASVAGAGTVEFSASPINHSGTYNITGATTFSGGTANFTGTVLSVGTLSLSAGGETANFSSGELITPVGTVTQSGGTLTGTDTITVAGMYNWTGGMQSGAGVTNLNGGLTLSGGAPKDVTGRTLNSPGTVTLTGTGGLRLGDSGVFNNNGTFDLQSDADIQAIFSAPRTFNNAGAFTKSAGTASTIGVDFNNSGTVSVTSGSLSFTGTFGQSGGSTRTCITAVPPSGLNLLGGSFFGVPPGPCTITGNINNTAGTVVVGDGMNLPVVFTLNSTYTQGAGANFTLPIGGTTPGGTANNFGQLNLSGNGNAILGGTLNVVLLNGFVPQSGNSFNPLNYGSRMGAFSNINLPDISPLAWHASQGPTSVVLSVVASGDPVINSDGSVNAASFAPGGAVAPGGIAAVFGSNLATSTATALAIPLPTTLGGATMLFNGAQSVPKFFATDSQVNIQIPWELQGASSANLTDTVNATTSPVEPVSLAMFAPGLFATNQAGTGQGAVLIANTTTFAAPAGSIPGAQSRPAVRGVDFLEIYWTGGGPVTNQPATGSAASANPLSTTTGNASVTIGGVPATVLFSGLAPGFVGLYVVTLQVPAGAPVGNAVNVILTIGGVQSNAVTIAVE